MEPWKLFHPKASPKEKIKKKTKTANSKETVILPIM